LRFARGQQPFEQPLRVPHQGRIMRVARMQRQAQQWRAASQRRRQRIEPGRHEAPDPVARRVHQRRRQQRTRRAQQMKA
jgi:hypothetical protein